MVCLLLGRGRFPTVHASEAAPSSTLSTSLLHCLLLLLWLLPSLLLASTTFARCLTVHPLASSSSSACCLHRRWAHSCHPIAIHHRQLLLLLLFQRALPVQCALSAG